MVMKWLAIIALSILVNTVGLLVAAGILIPDFHIPGFTLAGGVKAAILAGLVLTLLNMTVKPILRLFFGPIIILTLGLGLILVNAIILYILDFLSDNLTIDNIPALIWGAVIIGFLNFIVHLAEK